MKVPMNINTSDTGQSPMSQVSPENLLMAAADMHQRGALVEPQLRSAPGERTRPDVTKPHKGRKLKVIK